MIRPAGRFAVTLLCCALLSACALSQPAPPAGETPVSPLTVAAAIEDESLPMLADVANALVDSRAHAENVALVRWGGSIASVTNRPDGSTLVEIVSRPLYSGGRPIHDDRSYGRFLAVLDDFLDPDIVTVGRDMTVLGSLAGKFPGKVGESDYVFPVVQISDFRFWKPLVTLPPGHFTHWDRYPPFGKADPFRRDWPFGSRLRRPAQP